MTRYAILVDVFAKVIKKFTVYIHPLPLTAADTQNCFPIKTLIFVPFSILYSYKVLEFMYKSPALCNLHQLLCILSSIIEENHSESYTGSWQNLVGRLNIILSLLTRVDLPTCE